jgi:hypothetical protein
MWATIKNVYGILPMGLHYFSTKVILQQYRDCCSGIWYNFWYEIWRHTYLQLVPNILQWSRQRGNGNKWYWRLLVSNLSRNRTRDVLFTDLSRLHVTDWTEVLHRFYLIWINYWNHKSFIWVWKYVWCDWTLTARLICDWDNSSCCIV